MADEEKLNNSLQCHVCFEEYQVNKRIYQCRSGHSVCQLCRRHLDECPFCKAPYDGTRNYAVEEIVLQLKGSTSSTEGNVDKVSTVKPTAPEEDCVKSTNESNEMRPSPSSSGHSAPRSSYIGFDEEFKDTVMVNSPRPVQQNNSNPWVRCSGDFIPRNAIRGGLDHGNEPLYIGRAEHGRALLPGKVNGHYRLCYVPWGGREHEKTNFEVLCNVNGSWIPNSGGRIPKEALAAGRSEDGETLYIGRARIHGTLTIGKVHPSAGRCFLSYGGREYDEEDYEIFALDPYNAA